MQNRKTMKWIWSLRIIVITVCLGLTAAVSGAPACKTYRLDVPDPTTLNLKDGDHVIASIPTPDGNLEARVAVRRGVLSSTLYFIGGKRLDQTSESNIPAEIRECLRSAQRAQVDSSPDGDLRGNLPGLELSRVGTAAYAKGVKCVVLSSGCTKNYCYATVCCEAGGPAACEHRMVHITGTPF